LKSAALA